MTESYPKRKIRQSENNTCISPTIGHNSHTMNNKRTIDLSSMKPGLQAMAQRMVDAENNFIEVLMTLGEISKTEALKVLAVYRKLKLVKLDPVIGSMNVKHGAYLDKEVIANALAM